MLPILSNSNCYLATTAYQCHHNPRYYAPEELVVNDNVVW